MLKGMSLEQITVLARCNGLHTQTFRAGCENKWEGVLSQKKIEYINSN